MRTSLHTNNATRLTAETEADLAAFGLLRKAAMKHAAPKEDGNPAVFGLKEKGDSTELTFNVSAERLQEDGMIMAVAAPENKSFNMLVQTNFNEAVSTASESDLKRFLRGLLRKV